MWLAQCVKGQHTIYVRSEKILTGARALALAPSCPRASPTRVMLKLVYWLEMGHWSHDVWFWQANLKHRRRRLVLGQLDKVDTIWRLSAYLHILCLTEQLEQTESSCCQHSFLDMRSVIIRCRCSVPGVSELETHLAYMPTFELFFSRRYLVDILRSPFQG